MTYRNSLGASASASSIIPGLGELENDFKLVYPRLTSALASVRYDAGVYSGVIGRIQQLARPGAAVSVAMSAGEAQQLMLGLLARVGLAVAQARRLERAYAAGDARAIELAGRLVSGGRDGVRVAGALASAARAVSSGSSGLGLSTAEITFIVGLLAAPFTLGLSFPIASLLAAAQIITGINATLTESTGLLGSIGSIGGAFSGLPNPLKDAANNAVDNLTKPLGYMVAILAGTLAVGIVGYVGWNIYVARKAVKRVTGNPRRRRRARRIRRAA